MINMRKSVLNSPAVIGKTGRGFFGCPAYSRKVGVAVMCEYRPYKPVQEPQPVEPVTPFPYDLSKSLGENMPWIRREKTLWEKIKGFFNG